jgi:hypothetical protein
MKSGQSGAGLPTLIDGGIGAHPMRPQINQMTLRKKTMKDSI